MEVQAQPGIGIKPLLSLQRHYRVSIVVWFVVVLLGIPFAWIKGQSIYTVESVFQVAPRYMKNLQSDAEVEFQSNSQYREFVNHLSKTVTRYDVLQRALNNLRAQGIDPKPPALTERKYIEKLQTTIYVKAVLDTYMVKVGMEGGSQEKTYLHDLINAVMASFLETSKSEQIYGSSERLNVLQDSAAKLRSEVAAMEAERVQLGEKLGLTTFTDNAQNPYDNLLALAREKLSVAEVERSRADALFKAFLNQREIPAELGRSLLEMRLQDSGLQTLRTEVTKRVEELTQQISGLEDKHPARGPAVAEIKALQQRLHSKEEEFDHQNFENYRQRLQASLNQKQQVEQELRLSLNQFEGQSTEFARTFQQAMRLTKGIRERETRLQQIQERLNYLDTERNALGFVRIVTPALPAETPMGVGKTKMLLGVIIAAFGLALAAPIMVDMFDRRIRSVTEAEKLMGIPAAGWQIKREDLPTQLYSEDQTRRFVSALIRIKARHQRQTFAFTSVKSGGGTTTTVLDTARGLEKLGARALVVEANAFAPFADFDTLTPGLTDYLAGRAPLDQIIHNYLHKDSQLKVVGIGGDRSSGLQRLDLLMAAIQTWSSEYDYLLFDLPPFLLSADAEMLTETLGQIFLIVEAEAVEKGEVSRAKRLLQKIDPEAVGLFVNAVPLFRGSGYMEGVIIETLTRGKLANFMSLSQWKFQWELFRTQWALNRREKKESRQQRKAERAAKKQNKKNPLPPEPVAVPMAVTLPTELEQPSCPPQALAPAFNPEPTLLPDLNELIDLTPEPAKAPDPFRLNDQGMAAARRGDHETSIGLLCQAADLSQSAVHEFDAANALVVDLERQGWRTGPAKKAKIYLEKLQAEMSNDQRYVSLRQRYLTLLAQARQDRLSGKP